MNRMVCHRLVMKKAPSAMTTKAPADRRVNNSTSTKLAASMTSGNTTRK